MSAQRRLYPDATAAAAAASSAVLRYLDEAIQRAGTATLAVSGGSSPALMFDEMARQKFDWERVHLFWVDERAVPPTHERSNYRLAEEHFLAPAHFPETNVHRVRAELPPEDAARHYNVEIRTFFGLGESGLPQFDVIHRGAGPDAHTASLFPGEPLIDDRQGIAAALWVEKFGEWRITLLPGVLLAARKTVVLATGKDKAPAIQAIFNEPYEPRKYPSQLGLQEGRDVLWLLDAAANGA